MRFVYVHAATLLGWIAWNLGSLGYAPFDPTFVILATAASVEAIFLSTFILISQNRSSAVAERRAELDLHVSLLTEHEVTRILQMIAPMAERLGVEVPQDRGLEELQRDIAPEKVLDKIEQTRSRTGEDADSARQSAAPAILAAGDQGTKEPLPQKSCSRQNCASCRHVPPCSTLQRTSCGISCDLGTHGGGRRDEAGRHATCGLAHLSILVSGTRKRYARTITIVILARQGHITFK